MSAPIEPGLDTVALVSVLYARWKKQNGLTDHDVNHDRSQADRSTCAAKSCQGGPRVGGKSSDSPERTLLAAPLPSFRGCAVRSLSLQRGNVALDARTPRVSTARVLAQRQRFATGAPVRTRPLAGAAPRLLPNTWTNHVSLHRVLQLVRSNSMVGASDDVRVTQRSTSSKRVCLQQWSKRRRRPSALTRATTRYLDSAQHAQSLAEQASLKAAASVDNTFQSLTTARTQANLDGGTTRGARWAAIAEIGLYNMSCLQRYKVCEAGKCSCKLAPALCLVAASLCVHAQKCCCCCADHA